MKIPFSKFEGAHNDFIFMDAADLPESFSGPDLARQVCARKTSVGADGLVLIHDFAKAENPSSATFSWSFFNNDGSVAAMCGNAARCAVLYSYLQSGNPVCEFQTQIGTLKGLWTDRGVSVDLPVASPEVSPITLSLEGRDIFGYFVDSGVPHYVIVQESYSPYPQPLSLEIQKHETFAPDATNVTFLEATGDVKRTVSFERGVEDYTKACGTGAMACAFVLHHIQRDAVTEVQAPGGRLKVKILNTSVELSGPAKRLCEGNLFLG